MRESLRADYTARLMDGIGRIGPGPMFERFGAKFLDHHLDVALVHRGLNAQLSPVGHTIDSYDDAGRVGAEYSIDQDYFSGSMPKARDDLLHVLRKHPAVADIYLLSSRKAGEGVIAASTQRTEHWPGMLARALHVYDARRIAEVIVDELLPSDAAIVDLVEHLPERGRDRGRHRRAREIRGRCGLCRETSGAIRHLHVDRRGHVTPHRRS